MAYGAPDSQTKWLAPVLGLHTDTERAPFVFPLPGGGRGRSRSGEWNRKDMEGVVKGLRGLKAQ